uniref:Uncharacterized protein n=1 Tax=Rhizophora mucronata TaxID=61149 RepID=A0A2P2N2P5_RHIMU
MFILSDTCYSCRCHIVWNLIICAQLMQLLMDLSVFFHPSL